MFWKRKVSTNVHKAPPLFMTKAALWLNKQLLRWAASLQQKTMTFSPRKQKVLLGLFCLVFLACSGYVFIQSLVEKSLPFRITPIQVMPLSNRSIRQPAITTLEYMRLRQLKSSLDSLAQSPSGRLHLDRILKQYPHLLDTLSLLENVYHQQ